MVNVRMDTVESNLRSVEERLTGLEGAIETKTTELKGEISTLSKGMEEMTRLLLEMRSNNGKEKVDEAGRGLKGNSSVGSILGAAPSPGKEIPAAENEKQGCGSGLSGETLSEHGHQWIGLDISPSMLNIALEREAEGDLILGDMGQGLGLRPGVIDGAISISAVQWLCNADKSFHEPRLRLKAFFGTLYRCLARGARAVFQVYPENNAQRELILGFAMRAGFSGGVVVDFPHSSKKRKEYLVLTCGPPTLSNCTPRTKGEDEESCFDDDSSGDEENQTVYISDRHRPRKKQKTNKKGKGREWVLRKKEQMRSHGNTVPPDSKYTARKRKSRF